MKTYRYIKSIVGGLTLLVFSACTNEGNPLSEGENVSVTFRPTLGGKLSTRAIGDASGIDRLKVMVYEGTETLSRTFTCTEDWTIAQRNGITLSLIKGYSYKILFWAENEDNTAYTLHDDGNISVIYTDYTDGGFTKMEEMDAFYATTSITIESENIVPRQIELSRPFALLNFVDNATKPEQGTHKAIVTFHNIPTSFNPFTEEVRTDVRNVTFTFTDFPDETLDVENATYHYVASNYLFASSNTTRVSATIELYGNDTSFTKTFEFEGEKSIILKKNKKTNVIGGLLFGTETGNTSSEENSN